MQVSKAGNLVAEDAADYVALLQYHYERDWVGPATSTYVENRKRERVVAAALAGHNDLRYGDFSRLGDIQKGLGLEPFSADLTTDRSLTIRREAQKILTAIYGYPNEVACRNKRADFTIEKLYAQPSGTVYRQQIGGAFPDVDDALAFIDGDDDTSRHLVGYEILDRDELAHVITTGNLTYSVSA